MAEVSARRNLELKAVDPDPAATRAAALAHGAEEAVGYPLLYAAVRAGCRAAIFLSKRI